MSTEPRDGRGLRHLVWDPVRDELTPDAAQTRLVRLRSRLWLIAQAAFGAALAWWLARDVLGHPLPFFAPVTAMVCLGMTYGDRVRRILELTIGVAIGVLTGDLFVHVFGSGIWQIMAVCLVAMALATLAGAGQMLMMQAGIQGVIVTTLVAGEGEALSRWLDAVVGGGVALAIAMLAPMRSTTERPRGRAVLVLGNLAEVLTDTAQALRNRDVARATSSLRRARQLSTELEALRDSSAEALAASRLAPLLSRDSREDVREMHRLIHPLDLAIRNVRVLVRQAELALLEDQVVPDRYVELVTGLAEASAVILERLEQREPLDEAHEELVLLARDSTWSDPRAGLSAEVIRGQVRSTVVDLLVLSGMSGAEARRRVPATRDQISPDSAEG